MGNKNGAGWRSFAGGKEGTEVGTSERKFFWESDRKKPFHHLLFPHFISSHHGDRSFFVCRVDFI